jgi:uncharacterized sulfatase
MSRFSFSDFRPRKAIGLVALILTGLSGVFAVEPAAAKPNMLFIMLDDLGYAQIEAFAKGITLEDCDPKRVADVRSKDQYGPQQAFDMMRIASPTLGQLVRRGTTFRNAMACSNLCAPSRIGVATGVLQNRWGIYRNIDTEAHGLKPNSHLAEKIKALGYKTAHIGKWHIGARDTSLVDKIFDKHGKKMPKGISYWSMQKQYPELRKELEHFGYEGSVVREHHPLEHGFDYYFGYNQWECIFYNSTNVWEDFEPVGMIENYNTDVFTDKAIDFMDDSIDEGKPFYIQLHYHAVHHPLNVSAPENYRDRFTSGSEIVDNFYAHIYGVDANIKRMLDHLEEKGEAENTILVFTSDNGGAVGNESAMPGNAPYAGHKGMLDQGGFRVPLFFDWPKVIKRAQHKDMLVSTMDIIPTLIDAAGGQVPSDIDGKSLLSKLSTGDQSDVRDHFAVGGIHARVWAFNGSTSFFEHNVSREKAPSGYVVMDDKYVLRYVSKIIPNLYKDAVQGLDPSFALYNYREDPGERHDLSAQFPERVKEMKKIWLRESKDFPKPVEWDLDKWEAIVDQN